MLVGRKSLLFTCNFCTQTTSSMKWRNQMKQMQLVSQISSILLQRQNWAPLIQSLNLSSKLTPIIFHQILSRTQVNPEISLNFFKWAKTNLGFRPDFKSHCKLIQILVNSGLVTHAKPLLDSVIDSEPVEVVMDSMMNTSKDREPQSLVFSFVLECYSNHGLVFDGLKVFRMIGLCNLDPPSINSCNTLLDALQKKDEIKLALCFCSAIIRSGVSLNLFTWSLVARLLCKQQKVENAVKLLNSGVYSAVIYSLVIDCYCEMGNLTAAVFYLNQMHAKKFTPGFGIYSSVLDGACKSHNAEVVEMIMKDMVVKELLPAYPFLDSNPIIQKFCEFGRSYAAEMFFERATKDNCALDASYGFMLRVLCEKGRGKEAIRVYNVIKEKGITLSRNNYCAFADAICKEESSEEVDKLLKDVIARGYIPHGSVLSNLIATHCKQGRWKDAEDLLNVILDKGMLPDSFSCSSLVKHHCAIGQINLAVALNDKIEKRGGKLDVATYNKLLIGLFKESRTQEAIQVFDYMRRQNVVSSNSFCIMIVGLCHKHEMRIAMKIHDEMLKMQLKPDEVSVTIPCIPPSESNLWN